MQVMCAHTEMRDIINMVPHPRNPNKHPDKQLKLLAKIMKHQGWRHPITISKQSGYIVAGHGRLDAAKLNGWDSAPVDIQDFANEADEFAHLIADNKIAELADHDDGFMIEGIKDLEISDFELLGMEDFELPIEPDAAKDEIEDDVPTDVDTRCKPGDLWILGEHRLLCGDCTKDYNLLLNEIIPELCFTSPPYSNQRDYGGELDLCPEHLAKFLMAKCILYAVNLGIQRKNNEVVQYWDHYVNAAKNLGYKFLSWNIWDRGSAFSIGQQTAMFPIEHEWIFIFGDKKDLNLTIENKCAGSKTGVTNRQKDGSLKRKDPYNVRDKRPLGTIIRNDVDRDHSVDHPAKFPITLPESYIEACTKINDSVYDPFGGSGSTLIACEKTNRKCFMMELDPHYCSVIIERWEKYSGKEAKIVNQDS